MRAIEVGLNHGPAMRLPPASQALFTFPDAILGLTPPAFTLASAPRTLKT
jgi:hypothetical protein